MKKIISFLISLTLFLAIIPTSNLHAEQRITNGKQLVGSDYTYSAKLADKLNDVFKGKIGLYSGGREVKAPVGSSKMTEYNMFSVKDETTGDITAGWQCYIYANAVYNTLFNECVGHGEGLSHSKKVISKGGCYLSYKKMKKACVRTGAYVRVASSYDNGYNNNNGHSLIILSYDKSGIAYLEGNADNYGLVRVVESSWDEFNYKILTRLSRKVCYIIQPTKAYYNSLYFKPNKVTLSKIKRSENNQVELKWKKVSNVKGYQIKYSTDKKFTKNTDTKKAKSSAKSKTIRKLEDGKTYYFKVRAYNKTEKSNVYGKWSKVRNVKMVKEKEEITETETNIVAEQDTTKMSEPETTVPIEEETTRLVARETVLY